MSSSSKNKHTFAVMAYKAAPFLEDTLRSVIKQNNASDVYVTTSTPSDRIDQIAKSFDVPVYVNSGKAGIVNDWIFALSCAKTDYVTLVDQDDIYLPDYASTIVKLLERYSNSQIAFTNYLEIDHEGEIRKNNKTMRIKRILLWPYLLTSVLKSKFMKLMILRFGNHICSPSVTYNLRNLNINDLFDEQYAMSLDWDAWLNMSKNYGSMVYVRRPLIWHRIHMQTQTSGGISGGKRYEEDLRIFKRLWPDWFARMLAKAYSASYKSNK